ncbi:MAG: hypothetical protein QG629_124 [Patescibacteria group bacterium]|nr:endonuclease/exonuclease/phosphatase family protein [Candidatus Saccharibacteria bacterium]MDQ5963042.1 hypothetical protein [Patescibacteria group bacterium]
MRKIVSLSIANLALLLFVVAPLGTAYAAKSVPKESFRIASYNILGEAHVGKGNSIGKCGNGGGCMDVRADRVAKIVRGSLGFKSRTYLNTGFDVFGVQELGRTQFVIFDRKLPDYSHYPAAMENYSKRTIYWKKTRFILVDAGYVEYPWYGDARGQARGRAMWVKLKDRKTSGVFYVLNHHPVAWNKDRGWDRGGAQKREATAKIVSSWVKRTRKASKLPVFVIGDFNSEFQLRSLNDRAYSGNRKRLPYCTLTDQPMLHVLDARDNKKGKCPRDTKNSENFSIDHIFVTHGAKVINAVAMKRHTTLLKTASDHAPVFADVVVGGNTAVSMPDRVTRTIATPPDPPPEAEVLGADIGR